METRTHKFERAGLGKYPYRVVGNYESKYQSIPGDPNCPIQPGSSCDYCGTGIINVFVIRSADGKEFKVGCDCVAKAGDAGLKRQVKQIVNAETTRRRHARDDSRIEAGMKLLESCRSALEKTPHPNRWQSSRGLTMADWCDWMMANSGRAGKLRVVRHVEELARKRTELC